MNLIEIRNIIDAVVSVPGGRFENISKDLFNSIILDAQLEHFVEKTEAKDFDDLSPFKVTMGDNSPFLNVDLNGHANIPDDFHTTESMSRVVFNSDMVAPPNNSGLDSYPISIVSSEEWDDKMGSSIEFPTVEYPIANFQSDHIRFEPKSIQYVRFSYIKIPDTPLYVTKMENGVEQYDSVNSVQLVWSESNQYLIVQKMLRYLGISMNVEQIKDVKNEVR